MDSVKTIESADNRRIGYLDSVKGIAVLIVVFYHIEANWNSLLTRWYTPFMLAVFFCVSGMLLDVNREKRKSKPLKELIIKDAKSLLYPYFTFSALIILVLALRGESPRYLLSAFIYTVSLCGYGAPWFFPALFLSKIVFTLIERNVKKKSVLLLIIAFFIACVSFVTIFINGNPIFNTSVPMKLLRQTAYMLLRNSLGTTFLFVGYYFNRVINSKYFTENQVKVTVISIILFFVNFIPSSFNSNIDIRGGVGNPLIYFPTALVGSLTLIIICKAFCDKCRVLQFFGRNSIIIFCTHSTLGVIYMIRLLCYHLFGISSNGYPEVLLFFVLVMAVEIIMVFVINRFLPFLVKMPSFKRKQF